MLNIISKIIIVLIFVSVFVANAFADIPKDTKGIVIFDLREKNSNKVYSFDTTYTNEKILGELAKLYTNTTDSKPIVDFLEHYQNQVLKYTNNRIIATSSDRIDVFILDENDSSVEIRFEETERQSKIFADISKLSSIIAQKIEKATRLQIKSYYLTKEFGVLNVKATVPDKNGENVLAQSSLKTGPEEHLFLSADLRTSYSEQIVYNPTTATLQPKDNPNTFYVGLNYKIGDLDHKEGFINNLVIKLLFRPAANQDSFGIGISYKGEKLLNLWDTDTCSPYIAFMWSKNDKTQNQTSTEATSLAFGLSFDIDKIAKWLTN